MQNAFIEQLEEKLNKDESFKEILEDVSEYKNSKKKELLNQTGYADESLVHYIDTANQYHKDHGDINLQLSDVEAKGVLIKVRKDAYDRKITTNKEVILLLGLPGSGKSRIAKEIESRYKGNFYNIDSDDFKFGLKAKNGESITPAIADSTLKGIDIESIKKASSDLAAFVYNFLLETKFNIMRQKVGDNYKTLKDDLLRIHELGFKVYIHFIYSTVKTSLSRNLERFKKAIRENKEIRLVPPKAILDFGYRPLNNFLDIIDDKEVIIDDYVLWDGEHFDTPRAVFSKAKM